MKILKLTLILINSLILQIANASDPFSVYELNRNWKVLNENRNIEVDDLEIPFSVHSALLKAKKIDNPYYRYNDVEQRWIARDSNWVFLANFDINDDTILDNSSIINLEFHTIDSPAKVYLNDRFILFADNEFVRFKVENLASKLKQFDNKLEIKFLSSIDYAKSLADLYPYTLPVVCPPDVQRGECHVNKLRKQQSSFSWDWGPANAPMSLYRSVELKVIKSFAIDQASLSVYPKTPNQYPNEVNLLDWVIDIDVTFEINEANIANFEVSLTITIPLLKNYETNLTFVLDKNKRMQTKNFKIDYSFDNADVLEEYLWYPNGAGKQNLYGMELECNLDGQTAGKSLTFGFRSVRLIQEPVNPDDESHGLTFYFEINNKPIFLKGSNWIPADSFQENISEDDLKWLMHLAKDANMNSLHIWGGGLYERKEFYDLADRLGIMIWHDMMFACSVYASNRDFLHNVEEEIRYQVNRLRNHPSIIVWAGNNENEAALAHDWYQTKNDSDIYFNDYRKLYIEVIQETIRKIEPEASRPYLSSSPTNAKESEKENWIAQNPYDYKYGDVHFYNYEINGWEPENFPVSRMVSEYGFQSWPSYATLQPVIDEKQDADYYGNMSDHRQHHGNGNNEMELEISYNLKLPDKTNKVNNFKAMIYLTQVNQAMSLKTSTEYFLRKRDFMDENGLGKCMGAMYWQFNDIWQGASWSSIEYGGKMKMAHYYIKNVFADVLASPYIDRSNDTFKVLVVTSEVIEQTYVLSITVHNYDSFDAVFEITNEFNAVSYESETVFEMKLSEFEEQSKCSFTDAAKSCIIKIYCGPLNGTKELSENFFFMNNNLSKVEHLKTPEFKWTIEKIEDDLFEIKLNATELALFVWLDVVTNDFVGYFSENGFHMTQSYKKLTYKTKKNVDINDIRKHLQVTSLKNIYSTNIISASNLLSYNILLIFLINVLYLFIIN